MWYGLRLQPKPNPRCRIDGLCFIDRGPGRSTYRLSGCSLLLGGCKRKLASPAGFRIFRSAENHALRLKPPRRFPTEAPPAPPLDGKRPHRFESPARGLSGCSLLLGGRKRKLASPAGFEPTAFCSGGRRAIQLCHGDLVSTLYANMVAVRGYDKGFTAL